MNSSLPPPDGERRRAPRVPVAIPTRIDTEDENDGFAMARDVSQTGALLSTPRRLRIGDRAHFMFRLPGGEAVAMSGRIVRLQVDANDESGIGRYLAGVAFAGELPLPVERFAAAV